MEKENIDERAHSCKWYFDEAVDVYDSLVGLEEPDSSQPSEESALSKLAKAIAKNGGFALNKSNQPDENGENRPNIEVSSYSSNNMNHPEILNGSVFPLFLHDGLDKIARNDRKKDRENFVKSLSENEAKERWIATNFERKKFEICKTLNTIDSIVTGLCGNNVDNTSMGLDTHIVGRHTILKWLFTGGDATIANKQEQDRALEFYRQILLWWIKQAKSGYVSVEPLKGYTFANYEAAVKKKTSLDITGETAKNFYKRVRSSFKATIDQIHDIYGSLSGFRKYAVRANLATANMKDPENLDKVLLLAHGILNFLLSVCVSYMRIDKLQLPRAEFSGARLAHANISDSNFSSGDFSDASIADGSAKNCDFSMSTLANIEARNADFTGSLLSYANLSSGLFDGAILANCKLDSVTFGKMNTSEIKSLVNSVPNAFKDIGLSASNKDGYKQLPDEKNNSFQDDISEEYQKAFIGLNESIKEVITANPLYDDSETGIMAQARRLERFSLLTSFDDIYGCYEDAIDMVIQFGKSLSVTPETYCLICENAARYNREKSKDEAFISEPSLPISLKNSSLDGALLPRIDLSIVDFSKASIRNADMFDCRMSYAMAESVNFSNSNLFNMFAYRCEFPNSTFVGTNFGGARFVECNFKATSFDRSLFLGAVFAGSRGNSHSAMRFLNDLNEKCTDPELAGLPEISVPKDIKTIDEPAGNEAWTLKDSSFCGSNGTNAVFAGMEMTRCNFGQCLFRNANFFDCNASSTRWDGGDLTFSLHYGIQYTRSSFRDVSFQEMKATCCDFTCCNLKGAKLLASALEKCIFYDSNLSDVNLSHSMLRNCVFRDSLLANSLLSNAEFIECVFIGIDFADIVGLDRASFKDCYFVDCKNSKETFLQDSQTELLPNGRKGTRFYLCLGSGQILMTDVFDRSQLLASDGFTTTKDFTLADN